jgi:hypothetical protein
MLLNVMGLSQQADYDGASHAVFSLVCRLTVWQILPNRGYELVVPLRKKLEKLLGGDAAKRGQLIQQINIRIGNFKMKVEGFDRGIAADDFCPFYFSLQAFVQDTVLVSL